MAIVTESMVTRARRRALQRILARTIIGVVILVIVAIVSGTVFLHMWAARADQQAGKVLKELVSMRPGATTKADALSRLPGLKRTPKSEEDGRGVYEMTLQSSPIIDHVLSTALRKTGTAGYRAAYLYGFRKWWLSVRVDFQQGSVADVAYALRVATPDPQEPGSVNVNVGSLQSFEGVPVTTESVASPEYRVTNFERWPEQDITVAYTANAQHDLIRHAFNLNLACLSELRGCSKVEQVLPEAVVDKHVILKAAGLE